MLISGERVRQARELRSMTQVGLAKLVGVSQGAIAQIEAGAFLASDDLVREIAHRTCQPLRFFTQDAAAEFHVGSLLFRSHATMTKRELVGTYRYAQVVYELARRLVSRLREIPAKIPNLSGIDPSQAAREARKALGIAKNEPIPHLLNVLEWHGVMVIVVPDVKSRDAFSLWHEGMPILALSSSRSGDRSRMSVSHELGHLVLHAGKSRFEIDEEDATEFAAEFLMPGAVLRSEIKVPVTLSSLAALKPRWRVSIQALIVRARDLGIVTDRQYRYLFEQLSSMGWRKVEPVSILPEKPRALRQMAEMLYGDPIDYQSLAHDAALNLDFVRTLLAEYEEKGNGSSVGMGSKVVSFPRRARPA